MSQILIVSWYLFSLLVTSLQPLAGEPLAKETVPENADARLEVHDVIANEMGRIPILEYHSIGQTETRWTRSRTNFRKDLEWLYNNDYVLLSIEDYAHNRYPIPLGKKPVILTFDDGKTNQFRYLEDGQIDPDCAVGILDKFHEEFPEFGSAVAFYLNRYPFGSLSEAQKKIEYLYKTGRQIGYHTLDHNDLRHLGGEATLNLVKAQKEALDNLAPSGMLFTTLSYPHGWVPVENEQFISSLVTVGLLVGADPAYPLNHEKANPYRTPRIQAIDEEWLRHFGRNSGETRRLKGSEKFKVFISDGII